MWTSLAFLMPLTVGLFSPMSAVDLAYHVRAGTSILSSGSISRVDPYTFSVGGQPWLDQQWGAQVVFTLLHRAGGWDAVVFTQGLLFGATFVFVYLACRGAGASRRDASLLTIAGFIVAVPALAMRPQLLVLPLFAATLWIVSTRVGHPARMWTIPVLAALAANLHGSFPLFPLVVGLAWLDDRARGRALAGRTLMITALTAAATLLNPFGAGAWRYAFGLSTNPFIRTAIDEWAPVSLTHASGWLMIGSALLVVALLVCRATGVTWRALLTLGIFVVLAMSAQRAIVWWAMVAPATLAGMGVIGELGEAAASDEGSAGNRGVALAAIGALMVAAVAVLPWWPWSPAQALLEAPAGLTSAAQTTLPAGSRLFVDQSWGSWFEYAVPQDPVFVDARIEILPADVWGDYAAITSAGAGWREVLEKWQPDAILAAPNWKLIPYLRADPGWRVAYEDADGVLFVRA